MKQVKAIWVGIIPTILDVDLFHPTHRSATWYDRLNLDLTSPCHGHDLVQGILGIRPPAGQGGARLGFPGSLGPDRHHDIRLLTKA